MNGMVLPMARDLAKFGIRVAAIAPGIFHTPMGKDVPKKNMEALVASTPMLRADRPEEFAHFVESIVENSYINGIRLRIDGAIKMSNL